MIINSRSAAKARAVFNKDITREEAWQHCTNMFREGGLLVSSLVPGSYGLTPIKQAYNSDDPSKGDVFKYSTHTST